LNSKIHNLTLQGKTGIYFGLISTLYIYFNQFLITQFSFNSGITSVLPISFFEFILEVLLVIFILFSYVLVVFINKKRRKKISTKKWTFQSKKIRRIYLIHLIFGGLILFYLLNVGLIKLIIPTSIIIYGMASILVNRFTNGNSLLLGILFLLIGVCAITFPNYQFHLWAISYGGFHITYGILYAKK
jgi:cell division protein FtsL